jgi:hypothetical protein
MGSAAKVQTYWADLCFAFPAASLAKASDPVYKLIEAAEELGFSLEGGHISAEPPVDD